MNENCCSSNTFNSDPSQSTFGLDYFNIIHNTINKFVYPIPSTSPDEIIRLGNNSGTKLFNIINKRDEITTCVCEIVPTNIQSHTKLNDRVLIFSHGNGCDIYTFYSYAKSLGEKLGIRIIIWDYPSYGLSKGELNERSCCQGLFDVVHHYLKQTNKILLVGQSLGTGVVVDYVYKNKWSNPIILISPYKSLPQVITTSSLVENLIYKNKYASYLKISKILCPIKIFHGKSDEIIDVSHCIELYNLIPKKYFKPTLFENTGHNDILNKISTDDYKNVLVFI